MPMYVWHNVSLDRWSGFMLGTWGVLISTAALHNNTSTSDLQKNVYITPCSTVCTGVHVYMYCRSTLRNAAVYQEMASKCFMCGTPTKDTHLHVHVYMYEGSLTHWPSSQGWAPIILLFICACVFVLVGCGVLGLGFFLYSSIYSVLYTCTMNIYFHVYTWVYMYTCAYHIMGSYQNM